MNCSFCNQPQLVVLYKAKALDYSSEEQINLVHCSNCQLLQSQLDILQEQNVEEIYDQGAYKNREGFFHRISNWFLNFLEDGKIAYLKAEKNSSLLEVGTGKGRLLLRSKKQELKPFGQDIHIRVSQKVRELEIPLTEKLIDSSFNPDGFPKQFDHIVLWHVLEHIPNPTKFLKDLNKIAHSKTQVLIAVPNSSSWQYKLYKANWYHLDPSRHYFHFSEKTLTSMLQRSGFEIKKSFYGSFYQNFMGEYISFLNCFLRTKNFPFNFVRKNQKAFIEIPLSRKVIDLFLFILLSAIFILPIILFTFLSQLFKKSGTLVLLVKAQ